MLGWHLHVNQFPREQEEGWRQGRVSVGDTQTSLGDFPGLPGSSPRPPHGPALSFVPGVTMAHPVTRPPLGNCWA